MKKYLGTLIMTCLLTIGLMANPDVNGYAISSATYQDNGNGTIVVRIDADYTSTTTEWIDGVQITFPAGFEFVSSGGCTDGGVPAVQGATPNEVIIGNYPLGGSQFGGFGGSPDVYCVVMRYACGFDIGDAATSGDGATIDFDLDYVGDGFGETNGIGSTPAALFSDSAIDDGQGVDLACGGETPLSLIFQSFDGPGVISQSFPDFATTIQSADNFIVPAAGMTIEGVTFSGTFSTTGNCITSWEVEIYDDAAGLPGAIVCSESIILTDMLTAAPVLNLAVPCTLGAGDYWLSVYPDMNFGTCGQWFWNGSNGGDGVDFVLIDPTGLVGLASTWTSGPAQGVGETIDLGFELFACATCDLTVDATDPLCDDEGTTFNGSDDTFTFDVLVENTDANFTTFSDDQGNANIPYGTTVSYGPYDISAGDVTVIFCDDSNPGCSEEVIAVAPSPCADIQFEIGDPCSCVFDGPNLVGFSEYITLQGNPNQLWFLTTNNDGANTPGTTGLYSDISFATGIAEDASVSYNTGALATIDTELFFHMDGVGYYAEFTLDDGDGIYNPQTDVITVVVENICSESVNCTGIPTASEWGLIALALGLMSLVVIYVRRGESATSVA